MRIKRCLTLAAIASSLVSVPELRSQDYLLEVNPGNKAIYVNKLNLPNHITVHEALQSVLPELINRGSDQYANFDIQYDGKSVGNARDVILYQTKICDVKKIEVTTSSVSTQQNGNQSGSINIVPATPEKGLTADLSLLGSSTPNVMPHVAISYAKDKLELRGHAMFEYFGQKKDINSEEIAWGDRTVIAERTKGNFLQETVKLDLKYSITPKDVVKGWFIESFSKSGRISFRDSQCYEDKSAEMGQGWLLRTDKNDTTRAAQDSFLGQAQCEYEHQFNDERKFKVLAGYEFRKNVTNGISEIPGNLSGLALFKDKMFDSGNLKLTYETGVNLTRTRNTRISYNSRNTYVSPYFTLKLRHNAVKFDGGVRYQFFNRDVIHLSDFYKNPDQFDTSEHDVTADLNTVWQICPHHALRLNMSRNIRRPSDEMLFPNMNYDYATSTWICGNKYLKRAYFHDIDLSYITDLNHNGHDFIIHTGLSYIHANNLIVKTTHYTVPNDGSEELIVYDSYDNTGSAQIGKAYASLIYSYGIFTLNFAGNFFSDLSFKQNEGITSSDSRTFFNISINPTVNLSHDWLLSSRFIYNSRVALNDKTLGDGFYILARVCKSIGNWTFHAEFSDILGYVSHDYTKTYYGHINTRYNLYNKYLELGVTYRFHINK